MIEVTSPSDIETAGQASSSLRMHTSCRKAECGSQSPSRTKNVCPVKLKKLKVPKDRRKEKPPDAWIWQVPQKCRWKPPKKGDWVNTVPFRETSNWHA